MPNRRSSARTLFYFFHFSTDPPATAAKIRPAAAIASMRDLFKHDQHYHGQRASNYCHCMKRLIDLILGLIAAVRTKQILIGIFFAAGGPAFRWNFLHKEALRAWGSGGNRMPIISGVPAWLSISPVIFEFVRVAITPKWAGLVLSAAPISEQRPQRRQPKCSARKPLNRASSERCSKL